MGNEKRWKAALVAMALLVSASTFGQINCSNGSIEATSSTFPSQCLGQTETVQGRKPSRTNRRPCLLAAHSEFVRHPDLVAQRAAYVGLFGTTTTCVEIGVCPFWDTTTKYSPGSATCRSSAAASSARRCACASSFALFGYPARLWVSPHGQTSIWSCSGVLAGVPSMLNQAASSSSSSFLRLCNTSSGKIPA